MEARRESSFQKRRNPRKHFTSFSHSNHCNFFKTPQSPNHCYCCYPSSSSVFHPHSLSHPSTLINRHRKLDRTTKDEMNVSKRLKTSLPIGEGVVTKCLIITSTDRLGPDPSQLPKEIPRVLKFLPFSSASSIDEGLERFSGSVCSLSPPPSSLPLPKFSVVPMISCNAEVGGIDIGATNRLRCLLGL